MKYLYVNVHGNFQSFDHKNKKTNMLKNYVPMFDVKNNCLKSKNVKYLYNSNVNKLMLWASKV